MASDGKTYTGSGSTRWEWRRVKLAPAGTAPHQNGRRKASTLRLSRWTPTDRLTVTVEYRGGPEAWYELRTRGGVLRVPGVLSLHDVMAQVYAGNVYPLDQPAGPPPK